MGKKLRKLTRKHSIPFFINSDVELALFVEADGIHFMNADSKEIQKARDLLPKHTIYGLTVRSLEEMQNNPEFDYFSVGPVFASVTYPKVDARGLDNFKKFRERTKKVLLAAGGISVENAEEVFKAGADGVVVVSAILEADSHEEAGRRISLLVHLLNSTK